MHRKQDSRRRLLLVACMLGLALATAAPVAGQAVAPCGDARCEMRVRVPLDRSGVVAGTIDLSIRVDDRSWLPKNAGSRDGTLLVLLDAGQRTADFDSALDFELVESLGPLVGRGRIVSFDRRGTGASDRIACGAPVSASDRIAATAACAAALGSRRAFYTTRDSLADIEAVRDSLGVERLTIYGIGEGARLGLAYAAAHPERVERLVLDSPVTPGGADPLRLSAFAAARGYVRALCLRTCPFTDDAAADLVRLVKRTASTPLVGTVIDGHGRPRSLAVGPADLAGLLLGRNGEYHSPFVPALVHAALHGDAAPLARLVASVNVAAAAPLDAPSLVTACEDGPLPWPPGLGLVERRRALDAATAALPGRAFAPFGRGALAGLDTVDRCLGWPDPANAPQTRLVSPRVPTLVLAGRWDLETPPADSAALARSIPKAQLLLHPDAGHGVLRFSEPSSYDRLRSCAPRALAAFVAGTRLKPCPRVSDDYDGLPRPLRGRAWGTAPPPATFAAVRPASRRLPPQLGRTLAAARLTMYDLVGQTIEHLPRDSDESSFRELRFGGLRGGWALLNRHEWRAHNYEFVPGVALTVSLVRPRYLRIGGSAAVNGRLTRIVGCEESSCFGGRLGGHQVRIIIPGTA
jgi:pimeloyl-ACP methyl ester carboxylesterase